MTKTITKILNNVQLVNRSYVKQISKNSKYCFFAQCKFVYHMMESKSSILFLLKKVNLSYEYNKPQDFYVSQWQEKKKCIKYVIYRWIVAVFFVFSFVTSIVTANTCKQLSFYPIYLTNWNLTLTMIMTLWSALNSSMFYMNKIEIKTVMTRYLKLFWFLSSSVQMCAVLTSLIYWTILYNPEKNVVDLNNILVHVTNSLVLVIDLFIIKHPGRFGIYLFSLIYGSTYFFFTWLYPFLGGLNE
jgi:hypothetical protein